MTPTFAEVAAMLRELRTAWPKASNIASLAVLYVAAHPGCAPVDVVGALYGNREVSAGELVIRRLVRAGVLRQEDASIGAQIHKKLWVGSITPDGY